jgi:hypothetical protein
MSTCIKWKCVQIFSDSVSSRFYSTYKGYNRYCLDSSNPSLFLLVSCLAYISICSSETASVLRNIRRYNLTPVLLKFAVPQRYQYTTALCGQTIVTRAARGNPFASLSINTANRSTQHPNCSIQQNLSYSDILSAPSPPFP